MKLSYKSGMVALGTASLAASSAYALTSTFNISIAFTQPFTITEATPLDFGNVISNVASTYTLDTADAITATGSGAATGGAPASGDYTVADTGAATANIDISVGNFVANNGVTPQNAVCTWNGGAATPGCAFTNQANPAAGQTLTVGIQAVVDGTQGNGTSATPTFDITVGYN